MSKTTELMTLTEEQMKKVFRCPTAIAQGISTFNIPDDSLAQVKAGQRDYKLRVQPAKQEQNKIEERSASH